MSKPIRYTDSYKYPHGYKKAAETNVKLTFARARAAEEAKRKEAEAIEAETKAKVRTLKERNK